MRHARTPRRAGQNWATFLHNHTKDMWACDFLQVTDLFFRSLFAFFIIDMQSRRVIHVGVTRSPTDAWAAQQLREATPYGQSPNYLIRDRDNKFGSCFARVTATSGIKMLTTPYHAPRAMRSVSGFWGVSVESVSITFSSSMRSKRRRFLKRSNPPFFRQMCMDYLPRGSSQLLLIRKSVGLCGNIEQW